MLSHSKKINTQLFKKVLNNGKTYNFTYFSVKILESPIEDQSKFAFVVPKKVIKKAVSRVLLRRRSFNIIKKIYKNIPTSFFFIFFFKKGVERLNFPDLEKEIIRVFDEVVPLFN